MEFTVDTEKRDHGGSRPGLQVETIRTAESSRIFLVEMDVSTGVKSVIFAHLYLNFVFEAGWQQDDGDKLQAAPVANA